MVYSSTLLHGAAVCREVDDIFTAMAQPDPLRGIPMCSGKFNICNPRGSPNLFYSFILLFSSVFSPFSLFLPLDDHRYMCFQPSPLPLAHPLATQIVCLLAQYLVDLLDAVTGWISQNGMIAASYEPVSILWDVLGAIEAMVRMQDPIINRAHSRALYYDRTIQKRRHRRSSSIITSNNSSVKTSVVLDVLRNAGLVSSIIALFALLPEDPDMIGKRKSSNLCQEDEEKVVSETSSINNRIAEVKQDAYDKLVYEIDKVNDDDNVDDAEEEEADEDEDEVMLRDQLCKSAHLSGTLLQMLCRLDVEYITNAEGVLYDSLDDLLNISIEQLMPLERRFNKYLNMIKLPGKLVQRFNTMHSNDKNNDDE
jgi:hypothetical protein